MITMWTIPAPSGRWLVTLFLLGSLMLSLTPTHAQNPEPEPAPKKPQSSTPDIHGPGAHGPNDLPPNGLHRLLPVMFRMLNTSQVLQGRWDRALRFCPRRFPFVPLYLSFTCVLAGFPLSRPCKTAVTYIVDQLCNQLQSESPDDLHAMLCRQGVVPPPSPV